jgi:protein-disulfide isomerase
VRGPLTTIVAVAAIVVAGLPASGGATSGAAPASGDALLAGIPQSGSILGRPDAPVRLVIWEDLGCPHCRDLTRQGLPTLVRRYVRTGRVSLELRGLGVIRPGSKSALLYALAAGRQNRLWHVAGRFIERQDDLERVATPTGVRVLARGIPGLDVDRLLRDARSASVRREAARTLAEAQRLGIPGTPSFAVRIDGGPLRPALPRGVGATAMTELAEAALAQAR